MEHIEFNYKNPKKKRESYGDRQMEALRDRMVRVDVPYLSDWNDSSRERRNILLQMRKQRQLQIMSENPSIFGVRVNGK